ncbi:hypothetical protein JCM18899A_19140 [Nocardioides sp. AN3]
MHQGSPALAPDTPNDAALITIAEAARRLSVSPWQVSELCDAGKIPSGHVGRRRLVRPADIDEFAKRLVGASPRAIGQSDPMNPRGSYLRGCSDFLAAQR